MALIDCGYVKCETCGKAEPFAPQIRLVSIIE